MTPPDPAPASLPPDAPVCTLCGKQIALDAVVLCPRCGKAHHEGCWRGECGSYECAPARRDLGDNTPRQRVTFEEIGRAVPLPPMAPRMGRSVPPPPPPNRTHRLAIASLICALAGIPLFGIVTGMVAVVLGGLALGSIRATRQKGALFAGLGVTLGAADVVAWVVLLAIFGGWERGPVPDLRDMTLNTAELTHLRPAIQRAMRANVVIRNGSTLGAGVILKFDAGRAVILTNQHVVRPGFSESDQPTPTPPVNDNLVVIMVGQPPAAGRLEWVAPWGLDLAVVSAPRRGVAGEVAATDWQPSEAARLQIGDAVFAVGNPFAMNWTYSHGEVSQFRTWRVGSRELHIVQTQTPINPGNSGGGLYDDDGRLVGINTWVQDHRVSQGLGFAISIDSINEFLPDRFKPLAPTPQPQAHTP